MQHQEANRTLAVERYLLGEMTNAEAEQFEEHLFICRDCADSVKSGVLFVESARAVLSEPDSQAAREETRQAVKRKPTSWWDAFMTRSLVPALAALALLCLTGYQQLVVIRGLRARLEQVTAPQPLASFALHAVSRGAEESIVVPAEVHFFNLYFDVAEESASGYSCAILDGNGSVRFTEHLVQPKPESGGAVNLLIGRSTLPEGHYTLVVRVDSPRSAEIGRYPFKLEYR